MKRSLFTTSIILFALLLSAGASFAGKPFEGVITFKITYPDNKISESQMAMFPKLLTVSIKGTKARTDLEMSGMNTVEITDYVDKTKIALINMMGQKYAIKQTSAEIEKEMAKEAKPTICPFGRNQGNRRLYLQKGGDHGERRWCKNQLRSLLQQ